MCTRARGSFGTPICFRARWRLCLPPRPALVRALPPLCRRRRWVPVVPLLISTSVPSNGWSSLGVCVPRRSRLWKQSSNEAEKAERDTAQQLAVTKAEATVEAERLQISAAQEAAALRASAATEAAALRAELEATKAQLARALQPAQIMEHPEFTTSTTAAASASARRPSITRAHTAADLHHGPSAASFAHKLFGMGSLPSPLLRFPTPLLPKVAYSDESDCQSCGCQFGLLHRRAHCRVCGSSFCKSHVPERDMLVLQQPEYASGRKETSAIQSESTTAAGVDGSSGGNRRSSGTASNSGMREEKTRVRCCDACATDIVRRAEERAHSSHQGGVLLDGGAHVAAASASPSHISSAPRGMAAVSETGLSNSNGSPVTSMPMPSSMLTYLSGLGGIALSVAQQGLAHTSNRLQQPTFAPRATTTPRTRSASMASPSDTYLRKNAQFTAPSQHPSMLQQEDTSSDSSSDD